jgi:hypothetical protein
MLTRSEHASALSVVACAGIPTPAIADSEIAPATTAFLNLRIDSP